MPELLSCVNSHAFFLAFVDACRLVSRPQPAANSNWPRWRGPQQNGHTTETNLPVKWSSGNVLWKADLPGIGQSSPIIWGDRIFLTSALENGQRAAGLLRRSQQRQDRSGSNRPGRGSPSRATR